MTKFTDQELEQGGIDTAFEAHVQALWNALMTGLAGRDDEAACLGRFKAGVKLARHARDEALIALAETDVEA